jgi:hypothetical protein
MKSTTRLFPAWCGHCARVTQHVVNDLFSDDGGPAGQEIHCTMCSEPPKADW